MRGDALPALLCALLASVSLASADASGAAGEPLSAEAASDMAGGGLLTNIVRAMPHPGGEARPDAAPEANRAGPVRALDQEDEDLFAEGRHVRGLRESKDGVLRSAMRGCTTEQADAAATTSSVATAGTETSVSETSTVTASMSTSSVETGTVMNAALTKTEGPIPSASFNGSISTTSATPSAKVSKKTRKLQKKYVDLAVQEAEHTARLRAEEEAFHAQRAAAEKRLAEETKQIAAIRAELLAEAQQLRAMRVSEETRRQAEKRRERELKAIRAREKAQMRARAAAKRAAAAARKARLEHDREQKQRAKELAKLRRELAKRDALEAAMREERAKMQAVLAARASPPAAQAQHDEAAAVMRELLSYLKTSQPKAFDSADGIEQKKGKKSRKGKKLTRREKKALRKLKKQKRSSADEPSAQSTPPAFLPAPGGQDAVCFPQTSPIVTLYLQGVPQAPLLGGASRPGAGTVCYRHADLRAAGIVV